MNCFICNRESDPLQDHGFYIAESTAKYTGRDLATAIHNLVGDTFIVVVNDKDTICLTCASLIVELDRFKFETGIVEEILRRQINRKYGLGQANHLLDIDGAALSSFHINNGGSHECKECDTAVDHLDEIAAHYKYHQLTEPCLNGMRFEVKQEIQQMAQNTEHTAVYANCTSVEIEEIVKELEPLIDEECVASASQSDSNDRIKIDDEESNNEHLYEECIEEMAADELEISTTELNQYVDDLQCGVKESTTTSEYVIVDDAIQHSGVPEEGSQVAAHSTGKTSIQSESTDILQPNDEIEGILKAVLPLCLYQREFVENKIVAMFPKQKIRYKCTKCPYVTKLKHWIVTHYELKHGNQANKAKKFTCEKCMARFEHIYQIESHIKDNHLECRVCKETFGDRKELRNHVKDVHKKSTFECKFCGKFLRTCYARDSHEVSMHTGQYRHFCNYCGRGFSIAATLRIHIAAKHTLEPQMMCDLCGRSFIYYNDYKLHKLLHISDRPFKCGRCDEHFKTTSTRAKHVRQVHTKIPLHTCEYCGETFYTKDKYDLHVIGKHTHNFVHNCDECQRGFLRKKDLARHLKTQHNDTSMIEQMRAAHQHRMANLTIVMRDKTADESIDEDHSTAIKDEDAFEINVDTV